LKIKILYSYLLKSTKKALLLFLLVSCSSILYSQKKLIMPQHLQKGDTVAIVATARKIDVSTLQPGIKLLESWGLKVILGKTIGLQQNQLAGADWQRATDFQEMLDNPSVKAIWAAKGGYGTVKIVDRIDFSRFNKNPKWIVGFSDVTVLHSHINKLGFETAHAMMAISTPSATAAAKESLRKVFFGEKLSYTIPHHSFNKLGQAKGTLVGGNLSVLYSIQGSVSEVDLSGKILFLEDLDEYLYHIDRMMTNLKRNGSLKNVKGIIIGGMTSMNDNDIPWGKDALEIIQEVVKDLDIPVAYQFPAGHIKDNRALILGRNITLEVTDKETKVVFD
jgi:muramoyltetrapeptide carboxypeptidase